VFEENTITIYSSRDKIRNELITLAKEYLELDGIDFNKLSYMSYLINVLSGLTANLLYYSTSTYKEFFLTRAIQKESVLNLAAMIGYSPPYATPAQVSLLIGIPITFETLESQGNSLVIEFPQYHQYRAGDTIFSQDNKVTVTITNNSGILAYSVIEEITSNTGTNYRVLPKTTSVVNNTNTLYFTINATQIEKQELEYQIQKQQPYEFYVINLEFVGQLSNIETITTEDEGGTEQEWTLYDSLFLIPSGEYGYAFRRTSTGGQLMFGNGIIGQKAPEDEKCIITIDSTIGASGNVIAGSINKGATIYIIDDEIPRQLNYSVLNVEPAYNGADSQTISEIKASAIANLSSLNRLVSQYDYDNISDVIDDLPLTNPSHIMKRSDIKRNEIVLFSNILYSDSIVPTRNTVWTLSEATTPSLSIYMSDTITINSVDYYSMFNIDIDADEETATYYYLALSSENSVVINKTYSIEQGSPPETLVLPTTCNMDLTIHDGGGNVLDKADQKLTVQLNYDIVDASCDEADLNCYIETEWNGSVSQMTKETGYLEYDFDLQDIPDGEQSFYFKMYRLIDNPDYGQPGEPTHIPQYFNESQLDIIIKQDISDYMYSNIVVTGSSPNRTITIYDVPVIKKAYYDSADADNFKLLVYNKIISVNMASYRMATDFINIKFTNTTGQLTNMRLNKVTKNNVIDINPSAIPSSPNAEDRYIITNDENPFSVDPGIIVEYDEQGDTWVEYSMSINDIIYVENLSKKVIYNGEVVIDPVKSIPLVVSATVWKDPSYTNATEEGLISNIKEAIIDGLYSYFGADKPLYISQITEIIQGVTGIQHCKVVNPKHDIFFNYDIHEDLTQQELIEYTPDLVWFDTTMISITLR